MDFSNANQGLWQIFIWGGVIAILLLLAHMLTRKVRWIRNSLVPVGVLAGFMLLLLRSSGAMALLQLPDQGLEMLTYHGIAIGFIALSLRTTKTEVKGVFAFRSGALIVSTYLVQAILGLILSLALYYVMGHYFASGILLPMAYGQGPGQANNVGSTYEALGFSGGQSFGLSLAAAGYLTACIVGVIVTRRILKQRGLKREDQEMISGSVMTESFQDKNEVPLSESVDRLSIQLALILVSYFITYLITWGITALLGKVAPGAAGTIAPLFWGFNFITGSLVAMGTRGLLSQLRKKGVMSRQYQNNYLLNRISGLAFDLMIVAGIASIDISELKGLWLAFLIMAVLGGIVTYVYLKWIIPKLSPSYAEESFVGMYGMLTGTISSGILPLRVIDPQFKTPAADQLVVGSGTGILFGAPMLVLVGIAPLSPAMSFLTIGLCAAYLAVLIWFMIGKQLFGKGKQITSEEASQ